MSPGENKQGRANWYFLSLVSSVNGENETEKLSKWSKATEMVFLLEIHFPTSRLSTLILSKCHPFQITQEGCQMKMFRPSWWLEISALGRYIEIYFIILVFRFELWPFYKKEIEVEMKNWKLSLDFWENVLN